MSHGNIGGGGGCGKREEDRIAPGRGPSSPHPPARRFLGGVKMMHIFFIFHTLKKSC